MQEKKHYSTEFKIKIIREHLENGIGISELSRKNGINPNLIYKWQKELFEGAEKIFNRKTEERDRKAEYRIQKMEEKLRQKDGLISELVEDNIKLKKNITGVI
jgi:transposase